MKRSLIVFAKEPAKGKVKTRLSATLGEDNCLDLYKAFVMDVLDIARSVSVDERILAYDSHGTEPECLVSFAKDFKLYKQQGDDLGERMHNAFQFSKDIGATHTVIIGSDSPTIPSKFIQEAFGALSQFDIVLGPTQDGGYYLVGAKEPDCNLFKEVRWSSKYALEDTVNNVKSLKKKLYILDSWYDVDTSFDLANLKSILVKQDKGSAVFTRRILGL